MRRNKDGPKEKVMKCPHCGNNMRCRGPSDVVGTRRWKCRNKRCGRTVYKRASPPKEVIPIVYNKKV